MNPTQKVMELTRLMNNKIQEIEQLKHREQDIDESTKKEMDKINRERQIKQSEMTSQRMRNLQGEFYKQPSDLLKDDWNLFSKREDVRKNGDNEIRKLKDQESRLTRELDNIKRDIVHFQSMENDI